MITVHTHTLTDLAECIADTAGELVNYAIKQLSANSVSVILPSGDVAEVSLLEVGSAIDSTEESVGGDKK